MTREVFIVDEEAVFSRSIEGVVKYEGMKPKIYRDATSSVEHIIEAIKEKRDAVFLIDVTLAGGSDHNTFNRDITGNFSITGIILIKTILERVDVDREYRRRIILYTANYMSANWDKIHQFSNENGFRTWKKDTSANLDDIIEMIRD